MFRPLTAVLPVAAMICVSASALWANHTPVVSLTYLTDVPNQKTQRFDPNAVVWQTRATDHFDIYYTQQGELDDVARKAERAYSRLTLDLRHQLSEKVPLILLPAKGDLPRNEQEAIGIVRASGAPDRDHLLLPLEPRDRRATVLLHELTHLFQFELVANSRVPQWASDGLADHETRTWESADLVKVRAAATANAIPALVSLSDSDRVWGHAVFDFIAAEYGSRGVKQYLISLGDSTLSDSDIIRATFGISAAEFDGGFRRYVRMQLIQRSGVTPARGRRFHSTIERQEYFLHRETHCCATSLRL